MPFQRLMCPHCFRPVSVGNDAVCPACRRSTTEEGEGLRDLSLVEFVDGEKLPPVCILCGSSTISYTTVGERNESQEDDSVTVISRIMGALGGLISIEIGPRPVQREFKIAVQVPVCERHAHSKALTPIGVDYQRFRVTLPAHRKFVKRWKKTG